MLNSLVSGVDMPYSLLVPYSTYPCTTSSESTSIRALVSVMSVTETLDIEGAGMGAVVSSIAGGVVSVVVSAGSVWARAELAKISTTPATVERRRVVFIPQV